jgi:hypothetical protein
MLDARPRTLLQFWARAVVAALPVVAFLLVPAPAGAAPVEPPSVSATVAPGGSTTVQKTVQTPPIPPRPDIVFLADNTGSMADAIANVRTNASTIFATVLAAQPESQFGVALYRDFTDAVPYFLNQPITANTAAVQAAINTWTASGGGDEPEAQLNALFQLATDPAVGFRPNSTRVIAWFGDAPGHDPSGGHTLAQTISALTAANIRVIAVNTGANRLDLTGQATAITGATGGVLLSTGSDVAGAILSGLQNLPVAVAPSLGTCHPALTVTFTPATQTVTSGQNATFTETIAVAANAPQGTSLTCQVNFLLNGIQVAGFSQTTTIAVPDVTRPVVACQPTTNPSGNNVPRAGENPQSGQNPDGFYQVLASDNVDPRPQIFVADSASSFVAGPFVSGDKLKITQAPGATPNSMPGPQDIVAHLQLNGDALIFARDASGNVSARVACLVPPPPK